MGVALIGGASGVWATPIVVGGTVASEVDGLVVGGVTYNVTFIDGQRDSTFNGQPALAAAAVAELDNALNASTASFVNLSGCCSINNFVVQDNGPFRGISATSFSQQGNWQVINTDKIDNGSEAVFEVVANALPDPAAIPEPVEIGWLFAGATLAGLGLRWGQSNADRMHRAAGR